ncbi:hypothetical protein NC652_001265 [Populus alba x Populus x berolinensis]|nr:hypothetical protein NC652_001258 [Populus alba x Populus x berolinensis]KAJ6962549.1 hypothetical protein NC652_001265 [Populus alba x Populus x berolinensis]
MTPWQLQKHGGMKQQWLWMLNSGAQESQEKAIDINYGSRLARPLQLEKSDSGFPSRWASPPCLSFCTKLPSFFLTTNVESNLESYTISLL